MMCEDLLRWRNLTAEELSLYTYVGWREWWRERRKAAKKILMEGKRKRMAIEWLETSYGSGEVIAV